VAKAGRLIGSYSLGTTLHKLWSQAHAKPTLDKRGTIAFRNHAFTLKGTKIPKLKNSFRSLMDSKEEVNSAFAMCVGVAYAAEKGNMKRAAEKLGAPKTSIEEVIRTYEVKQEQQPARV